MTDRALTAQELTAQLDILTEVSDRLDTLAVQAGTDDRGGVVTAHTAVIQTLEEVRSLLPAAPDLAVALDTRIGHYQDRARHWREQTSVMRDRRAYDEANKAETRYLLYDEMANGLQQFRELYGGAS